MTILTLRRIREDRFEVTGPDIEPMTFKTRVEARDWCLTHYQGSPIREVGGRKKGTPAAVVATGELAEILERRPRSPRSAALPKKSPPSSKGLRPAVFRQSCNITGEEWVYASVAGRSSPVIVGWSTRNNTARGVCFK